MQRGGEFLQRRLDEGNQAFREMVESTGGMAKFDRRRAWFAANRDVIGDDPDLPLPGQVLRAPEGVGP